MRSKSDKSQPISYSDDFKDLLSNIELGVEDSKHPLEYQLSTSKKVISGHQDLVDRKAVQEVQDMIGAIYKNDKSVKKFILRNNDAFDGGESVVVALTEALKNNNHLEEIDLTNSAHNTISLIKLIDVLLENDSIPLKKLRLSQNHLAGNTLTKISQLIAKNSTLEELNIKMDPQEIISESNAKAVADSLKKNTTLLNLEFVSNHEIEPRSGYIIGQADKTKAVLRKISEDISLLPEGRKKNIENERAGILELAKASNDRVASEMALEEKYLINKYQDDKDFKAIRDGINSSFTRQLDKYMPDLSAHMQGRKLSKGPIEKYMPIARHCFNFIGKVNVSPILAASSVELDFSQLSQAMSDIEELNKEAKERKISNLQHSLTKSYDAYDVVRESFAGQLSAMSSAIAISYLEPLKNISEVKGYGLKKNDTRVYDLIAEKVMDEIAKGSNYESSTGSLWDNTVTILYEGMRKEWLKGKPIQVETKDNKNWYLRSMILKCDTEVYRHDGIAEAEKDKTEYKPELHEPKETKYQKEDKYLPAKMPSNHTIVQRYYTNEPRDKYHRLNILKERSSGMMAQAR
jgi:hypothetical protein